ncbi:MAG: SRPBCC family protein, partial [Polyangiaceae bacterium]
MTTAFVAEETIAQPLDRVWRVLTDWDNAHRWMNGIDRLSAAGPNALGNQLTFHTRVKDRGAEIVEYEVGWRIVL